MKKTGALIALMGMVLFVLATPTLAEDKKEVKISGEAKCAKCVLKEGDKCQNVIQTKEDGKTVSYYLAKNDVSKNFSENVCTEGKKVTATGTVKEVDGKKELTVSKIALAK
jgi:DNA/RNA endonuclease YhcR with UshA esterase domain